MSVIQKILLRSEALIATGMPGAHRFVVFFTIQFLFSREILGSVSSWLSIAQIIGFFTAIGWSSLVLVRTPKAISQRAEAQELANLSWMSAVSLMAAIALILLAGKLLDTLSIAAHVSVLLSGWTLYQLPRHYFISKRNYRKAILLDTTILAITICSLLISKSTQDIVLSISLPMALIGATQTAIILIKEKTKPSVNYFDFKGLEFGLTNFLSGGIALSIVPLANYLESPEIAGSISLFLSISAIALLVPRAISLHQISSLSKMMTASLDIRSTIRTMSMQILASNLATTIFSCIAAFFILNTTTDEGQSLLHVTTFGVLIAQSFVSTQSLVDSNVLMSAERSRLMLFMNIPLSMIFFGAASLLYTTRLDHSLVLICSTMLLITIARSLITKSHARKEIIKSIRKK